MISLRAECRRAECLVLTGTALLTRFWGLLSPRAVVWDEVHYERFAGSYVAGQNYLDVHPPLAKLLFGAAARLLHTPAQTLLGGEPAPWMRLLPALAGALIIPVVYLLMRALGATRPVAALAAAMLVVDNALLVESRFILPDPILILCVFAALTCYVVSRARSGRARWWYLVAAAVVGGMAASIKWTGLSALGMIGVAWCIDALRARLRTGELVREGALLVIAPAAVYVASFAVHFAIVGRTGQYAGFSFMHAFVSMNREMQAINAGWAGRASAGASRWYTWPIAKHSIGFWTDGAAAPNGSQRWIILFGNPVVWFGALVGVLAAGVAAVVRRADVARYRASVTFLAAGYALNFVPFAFITRPMYLYHYFVALIFSVMLGAMGAGLFLGLMREDADARWTFPSRRSRQVYAGIIGLAVATFLYLAPMSYGWRLSSEGLLHRRRLLERRVHPTPPPPTPGSAA